jgi:acyl-ACP thioesterase
MNPSPEQISQWRKKFESQYDRSQLGTMYERYIDLDVRESWGHYVEAREDALAEQATEIEEPLIVAVNNSAHSAPFTPITADDVTDEMVDNFNSQFTNGSGMTNDDVIAAAVNAYLRSKK